MCDVFVSFFYILKHLQYFGILYISILIALQLQIKKFFLHKIHITNTLVRSSNNQVSFTMDIKLYKKKQKQKLQAMTKYCSLGHQRVNTLDFRPCNWLYSMNSNGIHWQSTYLTLVFMFGFQSIINWFNPRMDWMYNENC